MPERAPESRPGDDGPDARGLRMRAAVARRYGPPAVVRIEEVERPSAGRDELLVRVRATTVNRTDCGYRGAKPFLIRGVAGLRAPRRPILGTEIAGDVVAVGAEVSTFAVGDRVFGYVEGRFGAHGEYAAVTAGPGFEGSLARIPDGISYQRAAPATEGAHYALSAFHWAKVRSGQRVLVNGATGAIGSAAVQLLAAMDVEVTAVCGTAHVDLIRDLGADRVIDYQVDDFTRDEGRFHVVLDTVGRSTFGRCRQLLLPGGTYVSSELGPFAQNPVLALVTPLLRGRQVRFPVPREDRAMVERLAAAMAAGSFVPLIDRTYPLERIVEAYEYVEAGQKIGNVVISLDE